ncbi:MAG: hypothetical protein HRT93_03075 [Piscirickettsiaceae bacterium]|nr:hypothetical protein [Piscirickettsiaceae bacterium]
MAKMLNMDEIQEEQKKVLKLGGSEYPMKELSVSEFIKLTQKAEKDEGKDMTLSEQVKELIQMVKDAFPTLEDKKLKALSLQQLNTIIGFARDIGEEGAKEAKK